MESLIIYGAIKSKKLFKFLALVRSGHEISRELLFTF